MIEQLFGSKTRVKLLQLFYGNPNRSFYVREITRKIDEQINSVRRELANLLNIGIILSDNNNNRLYYEVNQRYKYYEPLATMFGGSTTTSTKVTKKDKKDDTEKTSDEVDLKALGNVELAIYTGQFTRDESSGVDFLLVGDVNHNALIKFITDLETSEGKEIRYALMSPDEFEYRRQIRDRFIVKVLESKKQVLVDKQNVLAS
jgi:hypothetical protein